MIMSKLNLLFGLLFFLTLPLATHGQNAGINWEKYMFENAEASALFPGVPEETKTEKENMTTVKHVYGTGDNNIDFVPGL